MSMSHLPRPYLNDEEQRKRDDDRKAHYVHTAHAHAHTHTHTAHSSWPTPLRWRRRRILLGLAATFLVWLFVHNIPTDLGSVDQRMGRPLRPGHNVDGVQFGYSPSGLKSESEAQKGNGAKSHVQPPTGAPPKGSDYTSPELDHYFSGPIKFYNLARSLQTSTRTQRHNRNVLFAASALKSASNLIPMACEMARRDRNFVHLILLGRDSINLEDLLEINGVDPASCGVTFHDARPDYSEYSSDLRAEVSVAGAIDHVDRVLKPHAIITDDSIVEDVFFVKGLRAKANELSRPVIELPKDKYEDFLWITRLDCASLASWHKPIVNLLIHAPPRSSGSLLRLLASVKKADYAGLTPPRLTIDLPTDIEPFAHQYIKDLTWPPLADPSVPHHNSINLHHRISTAKATTESNTIRLLESFYPANTEHEHVLLLSSQAELSPLFYQYLHFHILEYRYSSTSSYSSEQLLGVALSAPQTYLNASGPFVGPVIADVAGRKHKDLKAKENDEDEPAPFLWQAPNADAALIFGDKWAEFHDYLKNRLRAVHEPASVRLTPVKSTKLISETRPGWVEYLLELMRARGWNLLFPAASDAGGWATVHQDLYQPPEEFLESLQARKDGNKDDRPSPASDEPFLSGDFSAPAETPIEQRATVKHSQPLHALLPFEGDLQEISHLPHMSYSGDILTIQALDAEVPRYKEKLRQQIGGCDAAQARLNRPAYVGRTDDLFCFVDGDVDDAEEVQTDEEVAEAIIDDDEGGGEEEDAAAHYARTAKAAAEARTAVRNQPPSATDKVVSPEQPPPVLDSTAKQKQAYANALGLGVDDNESATVPEKKGGGSMKPIVEDIGSTSNSAGTDI